MKTTTGSLARLGARRRAVRWLGRAGLGRGCRPGSGPRAARLLAALDRPASAAAVGRAYLAAIRPRPTGAGSPPGSKQALRCQACDPAQDRIALLRAALARQIRADFAAARVVRVDGWVLSETEARLCGLAALSAV